MDSMFNSAASFNRDLGSWSVAKLVSATSMFRSATSFNGNVFPWDVSNITDATDMFRGAESFDQMLCWELPAAAETSYMFIGSSGELLESCVSCSPGAYRLDAHTCEDCPAGFVSATHNQTRCDEACPVGTFAGVGASSCTPCAAGRFQNATARASCDPCPANHYQAAAGAPHYRSHRSFLNKNTSNNN